MPDQWIVLAGDIICGLLIFGPFEEKEDAEEWGREYGVIMNREIKVVKLMQSYDLDDYKRFVGSAPKNN